MRWQELPVYKLSQHHPSKIQLFISHNENYAHDDLEPLLQMMGLHHVVAPFLMGSLLGAYSCKDGFLEKRQ